MDFPSVILKPKEEGRLEGGHLWAFSNEVAEAPADISAGTLSDLFKSSKGYHRPLARRSALGAPQLSAAVLVRRGFL